MNKGWIILSHEILLFKPAASIIPTLKGGPTQTEYSEFSSQGSSLRKNILGSKNEHWENGEQWGLAPEILACRKKKIEEWSRGLKGFEAVGKLKIEIAGVSADLENISLSWPPCQDWESRPATGRRAPAGFPDSTWYFSLWSRREGELLCSQTNHHSWCSPEPGERHCGLHI